MSFADTLLLVRQNIAKAAALAGRHADDITVIAVSKTHGAEAVAEAITAGQKVFGENRVQEAAQKFPALKAEHPDLQLHLIGPLQSNKIKQALEIFDCIHSVDREKLAAGLAKQAPAGFPLLIQVNTGEEPQKAGIVPQEAGAFIDHCRHDLGLHIIGLMAIPPAHEPAAPHFMLLNKLAKKHGLPHLSMGMSHDYTAAVELGATFVRPGTVLFGKRDAAQ